MVRSKDLKDLSEEELALVIQRQFFLKNLVGPEGISYDCYYNKINESEWWMINLWQYLRLVDYSKPNSEYIEPTDFEIETWSNAEKGID